MGISSDKSDVSTAASEPAKLNVFSSIFFVYCLAALLVGVTLELSDIVSRVELQTINRRFEARPWLNWAPESIRRLNPQTLLKYHDEHEIPRRWWAWDYTLSWLIENNHPQVKHNTVIFNHSFEDEPPAEAITAHPWMEPLLQYPVSRATMATSVEFIAKAGARMIILDCDFPQYSKDDQRLAEAIHRCTTGATSGKPVPVLMTASVSRKSYDNVLQLHTYSPPRGVLEALSRLEPGADAVDKYTGSAGLLLDEDQVVRQLACYVPGRTGDDTQASVVIKALERMNEPIAQNLPMSMDIDFAGPPNSELYKIRPFWYLLDPERQKILSSPIPASSEPTLKDAVVIIGDGITDLHNTPYTNLGANLRSGSEVLAQAMDTMSRKSWPIRASLPEKILYLIASIAASGALMAWFKSRAELMARRSTGVTARYLALTAPDLAIVAASLALSSLVACLLFAYNGLIVPVVVPAAAILAGSLTASVWQACHLQFQSLKHELDEAKMRLTLIHDKHEAELREQAANARADIIQQDRERRREFGRRVNHDLKAPLSILNWTLAKLRSDGLTSQGAEDKLERLFKTANRLFNLIAELSSSYDFESTNNGVPSSENRCNVCEVILDCVTLHRAVADMIGSRVETDLPNGPVFAEVGIFQLTRVVDNLVGNALVHNPPGTIVKASLTAHADRHQIEVSDNGVGIPAEKLGDKMVKGSEKGSSGLGLSIVHALVRDMNAELTIKSTSERGTTIIVLLPAASLDDSESVKPPVIENMASPTETANDTCASKGAR